MAATSHFLELFQTARDRGDIGSVRLAVVCTGDESSAVLSTTEVEAMLDVPVAGRVPQLWGRSEPNRGFGAALAIPELDDAVYDLFAAFRSGSRPTSGASSASSAGPSAAPTRCVHGAASGRARDRAAPGRSRKLPLASRGPG